MAFQNKFIRHPKTGQSIMFLQTSKCTGGALLEMESTYSAHSIEPAPHYHPEQEEEFKVLSGELTVRIDGQVKLLKPGDRLHIPKNKVHSMWNNSAGKTVINWQVRPALNTEYFLEKAMGMAKDVKTNDKGMPGLLPVALLAHTYDREFRLAKPPFVIQKIIFSALAPLAQLNGYGKLCEKYID